MSNRLPKSNWAPGLPYPLEWAGAYSIPNTTNFDHHRQLYCDIVDWINTNIKHPEQNALWDKIGDCLYFCFRNKDDFVWFMLRWGQPQ